MTTRSEAPQDPRPYIRVSTDLPMHPKLAAIDDPAAGWAYVVSFCYSGQSLTDGHFPVKAVLRMAGVDEAVATALVEQELWHLPGHDCERCEQPKPGHAVVHDYLLHQRSADEVRDLTSKRREAGRKGAAKRWGEAKAEPRPKGKRIANAIASAMPNAQQDLWQTDSKPIAEERRGEIQTPTVSAAPPPASTAPTPEPDLSVTQRSKRITDAYAEAEPMCKWPAVNGIVIKAIKAEKWTDDEIRDALLRMAKENRPVTVDSLRIELGGLPPTGYRSQINKPYRNHEDPQAHKTSWERRRREQRQPSDS